MRKINHEFRDSNYYMTLTTEVTTEMAAEILADYLRYLEKEGIETEDLENPLALAYQKLVEVKHEILSSKVKELEDLYHIQGEFMFGRRYLEALKEKE